MNETSSISHRNAHGIRAVERRSYWRIVMKKRNIKMVAALTGGAYVAWGLVVWASAKGWNPTGTKWDFTNTGALGDSFGVLGSTMAGLAALFAMLTYREAAEENDRLRQRQDRMDQTAAEPSFLSLLERRFQIRDQVTIKLAHGEQAIEFAVRAAGEAVEFADPEVARRVCSEAIINYANLPQYFRFNYHVLRYALEQFEKRDDVVITKKSVSYRYARLLRSQLSDSEATLIALNCIYGEGRHKFKSLVERYALLHNVSEWSVDGHKLRDHFAESAFGLPD
ncbi:MAG TPA: hypothetical protein DCP26_10630 [Brevundimonas sp.]|nr:hypothetical protein [Brevundimonas sp.]